MSAADATASVGCGGSAAGRAGPGTGLELVVRRATAADFGPLSFFFDALLRRDYFVRRGQLREILGQRRHEVYVAELDTVLVGVAIATRGARLVNVLVHPAYRGLGIGRRLVQDSGAVEVRAKTDAWAGDPRGFYQRLGFEATGQRNARGNIELMRRRGPVLGGGPTDERCGHRRTG